VNISSSAAIKRVFIACLLVELLIVGLDLTINYGLLIKSSSIRNIFNVATEQSLGAWFSVLLTAFAGAVLLLLFILQTHQFKAWNAKGWAILSAFFFYLSADDAAKIHERVGGKIAKIIESDKTSSSSLSQWHDLFPSYDWQWVFGPVFAMMGAYILIFIYKQLPTKNLKTALFLAFFCWGIAVGIDFIEGQEFLFEFLANWWDVKLYTVSHPFLVLEEFLEMLGATFFLVVFISCLFSKLSYCQTISISSNG